MKETPKKSYLAEANEEAWILREDNLKVDRLFNLLVEKFNHNQDAEAFF